MRRAAGRGTASRISTGFADVACRCTVSGLPVFRPRRRRAGPGDAARADRRSQPQVARLGPASAGERKRLGQHACLDLDDRLSAAHRLCARLSGIRSLALRCGADDRGRRGRFASVRLPRGRTSCRSAENGTDADRPGEDQRAGCRRRRHDRDRRSRRRPRRGGLFQPHRNPGLGRRRRPRNCRRQRRSSG